MSENTGTEHNGSADRPTPAPAATTPQPAPEYAPQPTPAATDTPPAADAAAPTTPQPVAPQWTAPLPPPAPLQHTAPLQPPVAPATVQYPQTAPTAAYGAHAAPLAYDAAVDQPQDSPVDEPAASADPGYSGVGYPSAAAYPSTLAPAVTAPPKERKKVGMGLFAVSVIAAALVGGLAAGGTSLLFDQNNGGTVSSSNVAAAPVVVNNTNSVNQVSAAAAKAMPSVVTISATSGSSGGTGSGIILDTDGHILTNTHVVTLDGSAAHATIQVQTSNGAVYDGTIVGTDPLSDLAIIKIDAPDLVAATLGDSTKLNVGDTAIAIGSPLGLNATVTEGIVSTLNRTIQVASSAVPDTPSDSAPEDDGNGFQFSPPGGGQNSTAATGTVNLNVIQTDAAINPGNSGGALVNAQGEIIGVNVAIASTSSSSGSDSSSGNIGVGFSIPIDNAKRIAQEIIDTGAASHGQLGVSVSGTSALGASSQFSAGATVADVTSGSAAAKAGLQAGDVITKMGNRTIEDGSALTAAVREQAGGSTVKVTFSRGGKVMEKDVTLDTMTAG